MCVDYTDLNKHCPKDPFGLPRIDEVVDSTDDCELLSFLDCYSGYHQIALNKDDQIKTSFIMPFGAYCYMTMSFGLKNAGATYQRAIQECLKKEIQDELVEAYVDDVVVKTKESHSLIDDLTCTFTALNQYQWKLNPKKCIFGVPSSILLGNVISRDGIRRNLEKVQAVLNMKRPANVKDVQKLTGCMAALSRFLSRFGDKGLPFFKLLRAGKKFEWSEEADIAFTQLKQYLASPLVITAPSQEKSFNSTLPRLIKSSLLSSWSSARSLATLMVFSAQSISSVRCSTSPKLGTLRFKKLSTPYSLQPES
jgi:hypothetical protein